MEVKLFNDDCLNIMRELPDNSIDSIVTDPPYGIAFMNKKWDYDIPSVEIFSECLRVLKPGGHLLCFAGTRTQHRMATRIEDAGFEIRDMIAWVYGSGFPKSHNIGKKVKEFEGWGTALKPAMEPITVARKPFKGNVADNVLKYGTGGLNIDECRVSYSEECRMMKPSQANIDNPSEKCRQAGRRESVLELKPEGRWPANLIHDGSDEVTELFPESNSTPWPDRKSTGSFQKSKIVKGSGISDKGSASRFFYSVKSDEVKGRWPANIIHDGSDEVTELFPETKSCGNSDRFTKTSGGWKNKPYGNQVVSTPSDSGSASRFFYCAKTSKKDRNEGLDEFEKKQTKISDEAGERYLNDVRCSDGKYQAAKAPAQNNHPTVKPTDLMKYLCRLVTPKGGTVLDPFMGSGSTGKGAIMEGFNFIGIELDENYFEIAKGRIKHVTPTSFK